MTIRSLQRSTFLFSMFGLVLLAPDTALAQYQYPPPSPWYGPPGYGPPVDRSGLYLGLGAFGDAVVNQANSAVGFLTSGAGYDVTIGLRLSPNFALEFGLGQGFHNNVTDAWGDTVDYLALNQFTADAKLIFPGLGGQLQPFVEGGVGFYVLTDAFSSEIASGGGFQLGGGVDFWLNPWWTVGGRLLYHGIQFTSFTEPQVGRSSSPFLSTVSFEANAQIHF
jgi:hypothetical protein